MPQPPLDVKQYIESPLPPLREQYPPGTGGTGPRADWPEQPLKQVQVIDDFEQQAKECELDVRRADLLWRLTLCRDQQQAPE